MKANNTFAKALLLTAALFTTLVFTAQTPEKKPGKLSGGFGHFSFTGQMLNLSALNNYLKEEGYNQISPNQFSWGGGGNFAISNFLIGGEGQGFMNSKASNSLNSISFTGGYGLFNLGYIVYQRKRSILYPTIGVGGAEFDMVISQKVNSNPDFKDQLSAPAGSSQMQAGGIILQAQLAWQHVFYGEGTTGFFIGVKGGYHYCPNTWKLNINGSALSNSPGINMNGAYITLIIGGGGLTPGN
jgi:hypothetical protein